MLTRKQDKNDKQVKSITKAIHLIKVQTYNCVDTSNKSILFMRQKGKKQINLELIFHTKIIYSLKNNTSIAFYFLYNRNF